jgi:thioredoxin-like negative regulator of GroEL
MRCASDEQTFIPDISDKEFDDCLAQYHIPVLIKFWNPGCSRCQSLLKKLELVQAKTSTEPEIFKRNIEENYLIPGDLEISSLPTFALFTNREFNRFIGGIGNKNELLHQLAAWLPVNSSS